MSTKAEQIAKDVAAAVGAGKAVTSETVDYSDPNRPKTCLEVDFPILPVNQVAAIEGPAGKPIYSVSKYWARRRSSVFRSMLLAAAIKAPDDPTRSAKAVWDVYYANHQKRGSFAGIKVADIFMGGGTTIVEGSRLGMDVRGNDLNPVSWFVVQNEMARVEPRGVEDLLERLERLVRPQVMPFFATTCPRGHRGTWTHVKTGREVEATFNPLALAPNERSDYRYEGPEVIYTFWAKHGPCTRTGCGHRTPIHTTPLVATKTLTVRAWQDVPCGACRRIFDVEEAEARVAPGAAFVVTPSERPFAVLQRDGAVTCPGCGQVERAPKLAGKPKNKKVQLSLFVQPGWMFGSNRNGPNGVALGGTVGDEAGSTVAWLRLRAASCRLVEVRGPDIPDRIVCPDTGVELATQVGTVPKKSQFACGSCGTVQDVLKAVRASSRTAPAAPYLVQGHCPACSRAGFPYNGRFFAPFDDSNAYCAAVEEWSRRASTDLSGHWPAQSPIPEGLETSVRTPLAKYGYKSWVEFFNERQLLVHALLLKGIQELATSEDSRVAVLGGLQQYLRSNCMFTIWNIQGDKLEPALSKNNLQPPTRPVENCVFHNLGRGNWTSCAQGVLEGLEWARRPWEIVAKENLHRNAPLLADALGDAKSVKAETGDPVQGRVHLSCGSSTELAVDTGSVDLVITDPPFGDIMQYAELAGFFYPWLRVAFGGRPPFHTVSPPTALEVVENSSRHGAETPGFYKRLLTDCWREAARILKPGGMLAFTFHHDKDGPWVAVLESLFDAGFYIEATYPIRSDETKGEGSTPGTFGAQKVEYDIIHVCRKRLEDPRPVSWARLRRQILTESRRLQDILELHRAAGLPDADIAVVRRGKALEYFSKHYGKVLVEDGSPIEVKDALAGINQVLDQESGGVPDPPPANCFPKTWQFCRMFDQRSALARDQMQKYLKGSGYSTSDYEQSGWVVDEDKVYTMVAPLQFARTWVGRWRSGLRGDYEQAMFLIGASFEGSGINVTDTLSNESFKPHPALGGLLEWFTRRGGDSKIRAAAGRARQLYAQWQQKHADKDRQLKMFQDEEDAR